MTTNTNVLDVYKKVVKSGDLQKNPYEVVKLILQELSRTMQILSEDIEKKKQLDIKQHSSDL